MEKLNVHFQHYMVKQGLCSTELDLLQLSDNDFKQAAQALQSNWNTSFINHNNDKLASEKVYGSNPK
jgi:hypothetical protein